MKVSPDTIEVLKNFSGINPSILITTDKQLGVISESKNVIGLAKISEKFEQEFGIVDLNEFLATLDLFKEPSFSFADTHLAIKDDTKGSKSACKYFYTDSSVVPELPSLEKIVKAVKTCTIKFELSEADLKSILKASGILQSKYIVVESDGKKIFIAALDPKNKTSHQYSIEVGKGFGAKFQMVFLSTSISNLRTGDYEVLISKDKISQFKNTTVDITYYIALEDLSSYSE